MGNNGFSDKIPLRASFGLPAVGRDERKIVINSTLLTSR